MELTKLYNLENGITRVAGLMSRKGTILTKIIEHERRLEAQNGRSPYKVVAIFSDNLKSNAVDIGIKFSIPVIVRDIDAFYKEKNRPKSDLIIRKEFDEETVRVLKPYKINMAAFAGYMSIATDPLINSFFGVNVHPADLRIMDGEKRKYTGFHALRDSIVAGEKELRATTHIIEPEVDNGKILMISSPLKVEIPSNFGNYDSGAKAI